MIDEHIACAVAGITADANILINQARGPLLPSSSPPLLSPLLVSSSPLANVIIHQARGRPRRPGAVRCHSPLTCSSRPSRRRLACMPSATGLPTRSRSLSSSWFRASATRSRRTRSTVACARSGCRCSTPGGTRLLATSSTSPTRRATTWAGRPLALAPTTNRALVNSPEP